MASCSAAPEPMNVDDDRADQPNSPMLRLNDDCLLHIMNKLTPADLAAFALTCSRCLCLVHDEILQRKESMKTLDLITFCRQTEPVVSSQVQHYLQAFGHAITTINFTHPPNTVLWGQNEYEVAIQNELIFGHIVKYCGKTLRSLKMDHIYLRLPPSDEPYFPQLEALQLERCIELPDDDAYLRQPSRMFKLIVAWESATIMQFLPRFVNFESLERLRLIYMSIGHDFFPFLSRFKRLSDFALSYASQFHHLSMDVEDSTVALHSLTTLKTLALESSSCTTEFLACCGSSASLTNLTIQDVNWDVDMIEAFMRFRNLRQLQMHVIAFEEGLDTDFEAFEHCSTVIEFTVDAFMPFRSADLIKIVERMTNLEVLRIEPSFRTVDTRQKLSDAVYQRLVQIYRGRRQRLRIECRFRVGEPRDIVSQRLLNDDNNSQYVEFIPLP